MPPIQALEEKLGYRFRNRELLVRGLTHRSWVSERASPFVENGDNEQLEFLGDSILGFVVSESLVMGHPSLREGQLSQWKADLVSATHLHRCAAELGIGDHLLLGKGEERNGGRERKTLLANALEAIIAAVHMDGGIDPARRVIQEHVLGALDNPEHVSSIGLLNHKSVLHEKAQALGLPPPRYETVNTSGPEHAKVFTIQATIGDKFSSRGSGSSKKGASQHAAQLLLEQMNFEEKQESATSGGWRAAD
ncbi:MAG: ribonuclease III [Bryobacteraceae bacterium]